MSQARKSPDPGAGEGSRGGCAGFVREKLGFLQSPSGIRLKRASRFPEFDDFFALRLDNSLHLNFNKSCPPASKILYSSSWTILRTWTLKILYTSNSTVLCRSTSIILFPPIWTILGPSTSTILYSSNSTILCTSTSKTFYTPTLTILPALVLTIPLLRFRQFPTPRSGRSTVLRLR